MSQPSSVYQNWYSSSLEEANHKYCLFFKLKIYSEVLTTRVMYLEVVCTHSCHSAFLSGMSTEPSLGPRAGGGRRKVKGRQEGTRYEVKWKRIITKGTEHCSLWPFSRDEAGGCKLGCRYLACTVLLEIWEILHKNWDFWLFLGNLQDWPYWACISTRDHNWLEMSNSCPFERGTHSPAGNCPRPPPKLFYMQPESLKFMLSAGPLQAFEFVTSGLKEALELTQPTSKKCFPKWWFKG